MTISFDGIPVTLRVPGVYIEIDNRLAFRGLFRFRERILVIGQRSATAGGAAPDNRPVQIVSADEAAEQFGRGSMLHGMFDALKTANVFTETWGLAVPAPGTASTATGRIALAGAPTRAGALYIQIAGRPAYVGVARTDTLDEIVQNLTAVINGDPDMPVTATANLPTGAVELTCRWEGSSGNGIPLGINLYAQQQTPPGLTVVFQEMAGGALNPDIAPALATLGDERFEHVVMPFTDIDNIVALEAFLTDRWGPLRMIEGVGYLAYSGTFSEITAHAGNFNSHLLSLIASRNSPTPIWQWAAVYAAVCAFYGNIDPARPFQTLPLFPVRASPDPDDNFNFVERDLLLHSGVATSKVDDADNQVRLERAITTYRTNPSGAQDPSYLDLNTVLTLSFIRRDLRHYIASTFPRHKLANDGTPIAPGQAIATPRIIRDAIIGRFLQWQDAGLVENIEDFKSKLIVQRNSDDPNRVDAIVPADIVNQLRIIAAKLEFRL